MCLWGRKCFRTQEVQTTEKPDDQNHQVKLKVCYKKDIITTYIDQSMDYAGIYKLVRDMCSFDYGQTFTMKWMDNEGDVCCLESQLELEEAFRLYKLYKCSKLMIYVFSMNPETPGIPYAGETDINHGRSVRRCRHLHYTDGHMFKATRFHRLLRCAVCSHRIWGLVTKVYQCIKCNVTVHKDCCHHPSFQCTTYDQSVEDWDIPSEPAIPYSSVTPSSTSLQDFEILKVLGRGSYGKVLKVRYKKTMKFYAIKVIKKEVIDEEEDLSWVHTEKRVLTECSDYPFLVGLQSAFQSDSRLFLENKIKLPEEHAVFYAAEISLALNYLHCRGIIHRDIKPENVLLDGEGHIRVTDYGLCKDGLEPGEVTDTICGTPAYIAPEMLREEQYDVSVDWWSLGILIFEMLAGRVPFTMFSPLYQPDMDPTDVLFQYIVEKEVTCPAHFSTEAENIIHRIKDRLIKPDPECENKRKTGGKLHLGKTMLNCRGGKFKLLQTELQLRGDVS